MFKQAASNSLKASYRSLPIHTKPSTCKCTQRLMNTARQDTKGQISRFTHIATGTCVAATIAAIYSSNTIAHAEGPAAKTLTPQQDAPSTCPLESMPTVRYDSTPENMAAAKEELEKLLGKERVSEELGTRISHSSTEWSAAPRGELDKFALVVSPNSTEEVSKVAKICHKRRIPMVAYSGGTSLEGTLAAVQGGVCIDFRLMDKVVAIRKDDLDATVQPAVGYEQLNEQLAGQGLFFPPDPGPGAQIGGMVAQGCSGTNAFRYGTMKDWVLGLTVVLADGTIIKTRARPRKSSAGYDLTRIIVGSEGTLGFVTEANLKLTSLPENSRVAVAAFPNTQRAVEVAIKVVQADMPIAAMELLCDTSMRAVNEGGYCEKEYPEVPTIFFKFAGKDKAAVEKQIKTVEQFARDSKCKKFEFSSSDDEADAIWGARKTVLWSQLALKNDPSDEFLSADTAVPISKLGVAVNAAKKKIKESGMLGFCLGHVGDGNFHTTILYPQSEKQKARELITWVQRQAIELGGTITGEHGVGLEYRDELIEELGDGTIDAMRQIKMALDPLCLLNPEKLFKLKIEDARDS